MTDLQYVPLSDRSLLSLSGENVAEFLQGLVTNDVGDVANGRAIYAALLTPQGKYLHDFFIFPWKDALFVDCETGRRDDLVRRLSRYRLRAPIEIRDVNDAFDVFAVIGDEASARLGLAAQEGSLAAFANGLAYVDPRTAALGVRVAFPAGTGEKPLRDTGAVAADRAAYDRLRISFGIAGGAPEIEPEKSFPMDYGFDRLHGVSFTKGCYVGQEVTARMKSRSLVRKRLIPVEIEGTAPEIGAPITIGTTTAGELRAVSGELGLALVRIDLFEQAETEGVPLEAPGTRLYPRKAP